jgi:hypothetical protein
MYKCRQQNSSTPLSSHLLLQGQPQPPVSVEAQHCRQRQAAHHASQEVAEGCLQQ